MIVASLIFFQRHGTEKYCVCDQQPLVRPVQKTQTSLLGRCRILGIQCSCQGLFGLSGELFWTEEGYRYSWRVMLMEKSGYTSFKVVSQKQENLYGGQRRISTRYQIKQMSFVPDMILEYAHFLGDYYKAQGVEQVVFAESTSP